jgi:hypothetical protein
MLKVCASLISHPLTHICSHLLFTGIFPDQFKVSVVRPLYIVQKRGQNQYVSLLITFSKVLEKIMHNSIGNYLQTNNMLFPEQFGFRNGMSSENASFKLIDGILKSVINACWWNILFGKNF